MSKVAVVFWSATGNTETMANCVAEGANGTIVPCSEMNAAIQKKVLDECIIVPIYQQEDIHCLSAAVKGFRNGAFQSPLLKYCYFE